MNNLKVKTGDTVMVIAGDKDDVGKKGKIMSVDRDSMRVLVQGRNMVTRHTRPRRQGDAGGRIEKESSIHVSNVMLVCPKCNKPTRVGYTFVEGKNGKAKKVRTCKKCDKAID
ncbi:MAG: 50S ribosomal protein L24 [Clostridia bacterium]|nr:50S ribosomal protein L24 [Clostridia bacterium]